MQCMYVFSLLKGIKLPWPSIDPRDLKTIMPGSRIGSLSLRSSADPMPMGFPLLPASAVGAPIVEVKSAAVHVTPSGRRPRSARGSRPIFGRLCSRWLHLTALASISTFFFVTSEFL